MKITIPKDKPKKVVKLDVQKENENKMECGWCYGGCMKKGKYRQVNEDRFSILTIATGNFNGIIAGVYDGFESNLCSHILSELLIKEIITDLQIFFQNENQDNEAHKLKSIFQNKSNLIMKTLGEQRGGSTCILAIFVKNKIYVINVGDSFACLINEKESRIINSFHNSKNEKEIQNIIEKGWIILKVGGITRIQGELSITRALGNQFRCKEFISSDPDIYTYIIQDNDLYLLLGSDGLLNHFSKEEIQKYILDHKQSNELELAEGLVDQAFYKGTKDNVTAVLINLKKIANFFWFLINL